MILTPEQPLPVSMQRPAARFTFQNIKPGKLTNRNDNLLALIWNKVNSGLFSQMQCERGPRGWDMNYGPEHE